MLRWVKLEPEFVDVSQRDEQVFVSVYMGISDDLSGFEWAELVFASMYSAPPVPPADSRETYASPVRANIRRLTCGRTGRIILHFRHILPEKGT